MLLLIFNKTIFGIQQTNNMTQHTESVIKYSTQNTRNLKKSQNSVYLKFNHNFY